MNNKSGLLLGLITLFSLNADALGITLDGNKSGDGYGLPFAIQTVNTGFGDNLSELNAAYAQVQDGQLHLMFTGNLENVWNRLEIFIDSTPGGMNEVYRPGSVFDRFTFDDGFAPDYLLETISGPNRFHFHYSQFDEDITSGTDTYLNVFDGEEQGAAQTAVGPQGYSFGIAFDNSNTAGVLDGDSPANKAAAALVATGIELSIPLPAIGNPEGPFKILAMINGASSNFLSNQFLGGLRPAQGNLGSDGLGNGYQTLALIDLNDFDGDQYFIFDPNRLTGDINSDGFVGIEDLNLVLGSWNLNTPPGNPLADANQDGFVGIDDLNYVLSDWNTGTPLATDTNIPEPGTLLVCMACVGPLLRKPHR
tara:strand:+ start:160 stop:1254 length:1095 start_codon:yes stop_codon:yes gene_type:complete